MSKADILHHYLVSGEGSEEQRACWADELYDLHEKREKERDEARKGRELERKLDSPLRVDVEGDELVIRIGLERITGNDDHDEIPDLPITDPHTWGREICRELDRDRGDGATPISLLFDKMILNAIDNGACGIDLKRLREIQANTEDIRASQTND